MVAYHAGKAAKVAPPATTSHTSLPSHTGPIVRSSVAALLVRARDERQQHPDAEVEALEQEVAGPEDGDQAEPEGLEIHQ